MGHVTRREPRIQSIKRGKYLDWEKNLPFPDFFSAERKGERERKVSINDSLDFVGPRTKVHHLDEGYP